MSFETTVYILASVVLVSLVSFIGIVLLSFQRALLEKLLLVLVSFAIGTLIGDAFIHILPEVLEEGLEPSLFGTYALIGVLVFFSIEKFLRWHHRHLFHSQEGEHLHRQVKPYVWMNLFGDGVHNFVDGMVIAGSYLTSIPLGITTTLAVIAHEGAQELGDFAVLIRGGVSQRKALWYNFLSAVAAIVGGLVTLLLQTQFENVSSFLLPFTFAGFLYIALGTLIPELHQETLPRQLLAQAVGILIGIGLMVLLAGF